MTKEDDEVTDVLLRRVPNDLLADVDAYAIEAAGAAAKPSRTAAIFALLARGLKDVRRGR